MIVTARVAYNPEKLKSKFRKYQITEKRLAAGLKSHEDGSCQLRISDDL